MKTFDVYAHHPYACAGNEPPNYVPKGKDKRRIQLGNINVLIAKITKFYGPKHLWITEYGYQTNPPDKTIFGVELGEAGAVPDSRPTRSRARTRAST